MRKTIINKLFWALKICVFNMLAAVSLLAHAEYYLVYSTPEPSDQCVFCQSRSQFIDFGTPELRAKKHHRAHTHRYSHRKTGLYVYYPRQQHCPCNQVWTLEFCQCCPNPNRVRSQWGDYIVFSSRPADRTHGLTPEEGNIYNPDMSTSDDGNADLEVNQ